MDKSRGKGAIDKHFPNGLPNSRLITDRHSSCFKMDVKGHQICLAHLLRELTYLHGLEPQASKLKQKVSGGFRPDSGAVIHSIADTAKKNKQSPFLALKTIAQYT